MVLPAKNTVSPRGLQVILLGIRMDAPGVNARDKEVTYCANAPRSIGFPQGGLKRHSCTMLAWTTLAALVQWPCSCHNLTGSARAGVAVHHRRASVTYLGLLTQLST